MDHDLTFDVTVSDGATSISDSVTVSFAADTDYAAELGEATGLLDATTWSGGAESVEETLKYVTLVSDDLIPVDVSKSYNLSGISRSGDDSGNQFNPANRQYAGFASYDIDGNLISSQYAYHFGGSETTLSDPLNPGETVVHLTSAAGWSTNSNAYDRAFAWYGYTDGTGYTYPDYTYTRNLVFDNTGGTSGPGALPSNGVDLENNTITLSQPDTDADGGAIKATCPPHPALQIQEGQVDSEEEAQAADEQEGSWPKVHAPYPRAIAKTNSQSRMICQLPKAVL